LTHSDQAVIPSDTLLLARSNSPVLSVHQIWGGPPLNFPTFSGHAFIRTNLSLPAIRGSIDYALNCAATKAARIAETPISRCWALRANFRSAVEFRASLKVIRHASQPVSTLRSGPTANKLACIGVQKTPSKGGSNVF
jgi:hypothetical protein